MKISDFELTFKKGKYIIMHKFVHILTCIEEYHSDQNTRHLKEILKSSVSFNQKELICVQDNL